MSQPQCSCTRPTLFVGLDIGATYSGAYSVLAQFCATHSVFEVKSEYEVSEFPTALALEGNMNVRFVRSPTEIRGNEIPLWHCKLTLMSSENWSNHDEDKRFVYWVKKGWEQHQPRVGEAEAFGVFLRGLFDQVVDGWHHQTLENATVSVVVTHPACWNAQTLEALGKAVESSHIKTQQSIGIATEIQYEVEHMMALKGILHREPSTMHELRKAGGSVIILDVGDLTIDGIVHRYASNRATDPGRAPSSESRLGGALLVDEAFAHFRDKWIENYVPNQSKIPGSILKDEKEKMERKWKEDYMWDYLPVKIGERLQIEFFEHQMILSRDNFMSFFEKHLNLLLEIINRLVDMEVEITSVSPKLVTLTGRMSRCKYLKMALGARLRSQGISLVPSTDIDRLNIVSYGAAYRCDPSITAQMSALGEASVHGGQ